MSSSPIVKTWCGVDTSSWSFLAPRSALVENWEPSANARSFDLTLSGPPCGGSGRCSGIPISSALGFVTDVPGPGALVSVPELVVAHEDFGVAFPRIGHLDPFGPVAQRPSTQRHDVASAALPR